MKHTTIIVVFGGIFALAACKQGGDKSSDKADESADKAAPAQQHCPSSRGDCREACRSQGLLQFKEQALLIKALDKDDMLGKLVDNCVKACREQWTPQTVDCVAAATSEAALDKCPGTEKTRDALTKDRKAITAAVQQYVLSAKTTEAIDQLDKIYKSASVYYTSPRVERGTGNKLPCQFPATQAMTPNVSNKACCGGALDTDGDNRCDVNTSQWTTPTWSALNFQMNDQHYFGYAFESSGSLATAKFTARAHADLDCDGVLSTFERYGYGDETASRAECSMKGSSAFKKYNETE